MMFSASDVGHTLINEETSPQEVNLILERTCEILEKGQVIWLYRHAQIIQKQEGVRSHWRGLSIHGKESSDQFCVDFVEASKRHNSSLNFS